MDAPSLSGGRLFPGAGLGSSLVDVCSLLGPMDCFGSETLEEF